MPAIGIHKTDTSDASWDGPQNKANLKNGAEEAYYRKAFAWQDPDGDPKTKVAWKFIHHNVSTAGMIGAANIRGCQFGIGVLNGAMGGAKIPDTDKQGVWDHLAAHLKDAKVTPAELKSAGIPPEIERRFLENRVRAVEAGAAPVISGMAAVYDQEAVIGNLFREVIRPGAFTRVLSENPDVVGSPNHNWDVVLGRTIAGTLKLEDRVNDGLYYDIQVNPKDREAMNFYSRVQRGDIRHSSFAFTVREGKERWTDPPTPRGLPLREILEVEKLYDISPVTFPAYSTTTAQARKQANAIQQRMLERQAQAGSGGPEVEAGKAEARRKARAHWLRIEESKY